MKKIVRITENDLTRIVKRVLKEDNGFRPIDGSGKKTTEIGKIISKKYQKRNGDTIEKYFINVNDDENDILLCDDIIDSEFKDFIDNNSKEVQFTWVGMNRPHGSPRGGNNCSSIGDLSLEMYERGKEDNVDDWWNNEI